MSKNKNEEKEQEKQFYKSQFVSSKKYASNRDLLQVLLEDNKMYTLEEVNNKIEEFKKRKV